MIDFILPPIKLRHRISVHQVYRAIFNGVMWVFFVSSHLKNFPNKEFFLSKEGYLPIIDSGKTGEDYILHIAKDIDHKKAMAP